MLGLRSPDLLDSPEGETIALINIGIVMPKIIPELSDRREEISAALSELARVGSCVKNATMVSPNKTPDPGTKKIQRAVMAEIIWEKHIDRKELFMSAST